MAVPMMALAVTVPQAAAILMPVLLLMDLLGIAAFRKDFDRALLRFILPFGVLGIVVGALLFKLLNAHTVAAIVGVFTLLFLAQRLLFPPKPNSPLPPQWMGAVLSTLSGFTSFVAHAGGPPINAYVIPLKLSPLRFTAGAVAHRADWGVDWRALGAAHQPGAVLPLLICGHAVDGAEAGVGRVGCVRRRATRDNADNMFEVALPPHAVSVLRTARLARSAKPFRARGGPHGERCAGCRLVLSHCLCTVRPVVATRAGVCLLMADIEPLKPSNTGWLIADVVADTFAFGWARTEVDPALLALLADPQWQPYVVFPGEFVAAERVVTQLMTESYEGPHFRVNPRGVGAWGRPLFILLDATWPEARKMFRKSPYLNHLPVLSLASEQISRYKLRRSRRDDHFCTSEVAALCLDLADEPLAAQTLEAYLDVFTHHYLRAKNQLPVQWDGEAHARLRELGQPEAALA